MSLEFVWRRRWLWRFLLAGLSFFALAAFGAAALVWDGLHDHLHRADVGVVLSSKAPARAVAGRGGTVRVG